MDLLMIIIFLLGVIGIALELGEGHLPETIKKLLGVNEEKKWMITFSKIGNYWRVLPKWMWFVPLTPIFIFLTIILLRIYRELIYGLSCPYCLSFHLGWATALFVMSWTILPSLLFGGAAVLITKLLSKYTL